MDPLVISNNLKLLTQHTVSALAGVTEQSVNEDSERFASLETQLSNLQKMVVDGGMGPLSISTDPIKFQADELKQQNARLETNSHAALNRMKETFIGGMG